MTFARTLMMTLVSLLTITAAQTVEADSFRGESSPKIAHRMRTDVGGHPLVESSSTATGDGTVRFITGMYREIDKSSPKIAHRTLQTKGGKVISKARLPKCKGCGTRHGKPHCPVFGTKSSIDSVPFLSTGMYRDRGKSSPKIAHGKLSIMEENIAGRTNRDNLNER